jgi:precorrin-4 C11-methyltransferase
MTPPTKIALIAVTRRGAEQARLLRRRLRAGEVHRPARYGPAEHPWEVLFDGPLAESVPRLFAECEQLVFFLAAGAVTRLIAPCLSSKETDPGVLAVDEAGRFVIPLLSGHKGGANAFARTVAGCLGATPVITTASDVIGGLSLDLLEEEFGWVAEPRERLKDAALALVNGAPVAIVQEVGRPGSWLDERDLPANVTFVRALSDLPLREYESIVWVTDRLRRTDFQSVPSEDGRIFNPSYGERTLWFRPRSLVLGVGCERGLSAEALEDGLDRFLLEHRFARAAVATVASVDIKADEEAIIEVARRSGWQTSFYPAEELARVVAAPNPSEVVARCVGTPGVAEPAALLASGAAQLLVEKQVIASPLAPQRMTFALARLTAFETPSAPNPVLFVGAGPGDPDLVTLKAKRALARADVVVYAGSLVPEEVLRHAPATAALHNSAPLTLEEVMAVMVPAARSGKRVVRLHSGDTSLYSAIQEQMTRLDEVGVGYEVVPGVSAFQAAAAALKAEFTLPEVVQTVILTRAEGETPMPAGESLAEMARHRATLCIFLSARLADRVQEQLLTAYPADTPAAILYRVSWPDEKIVLTELGSLAEEVRRHKLSRTTLIVVGEAVRGRRNRSRLYSAEHGHIFRGRDRGEASPPA